jgi:hypothetical protein
VPITAPQQSYDNAGRKVCMHVNFIGLSKHQNVKKAYILLLLIAASAIKENKFW